MRASLYSPAVSSVFLLFICVVGGCSYGDYANDSSEKVVEGEALWEKLIEFENALDQPLLNPFYAGISFGGNSPLSNNLVVILLDGEKEVEARTALAEVFDQSVAERIEIEVWSESETVASEELKRELPVFETAESVASLDYDERIDRLSIGIRDLDAVKKLENMIEREGVPREAAVILPEEYVQEE